MMSGKYIRMLLVLWRKLIWCVIRMIVFFFSVFLMYFFVVNIIIIVLVKVKLFKFVICMMLLRFYNVFWINSLSYILNIVDLVWVLIVLKMLFKR